MNHASINASNFNVRFGRQLILIYIYMIQYSKVHLYIDNANINNSIFSNWICDQNIKECKHETTSTNVFNKVFYE